MTDAIRFIHANNGEVLEVVIGDTSYTPEQVRAALMALPRARAWARSWKRLAKEYYVAYDEACDDEAAAVITRDARVEVLELALIDLENWIIAAEPLVPFGLPASYGQWRRPGAK